MTHIEFLPTWCLGCAIAIIGLLCIISFGLMLNYRRKYLRAVFHDQKTTDTLNNLSRVNTELARDNSNLDIRLKHAEETLRATVEKSQRTASEFAQERDKLLEDNARLKRVNELSATRLNKYMEFAQTVESELSQTAQQNSRIYKVRAAYKKLQEEVSDL